MRPYHLPVRCLDRTAAATYLGIGRTLLARIGHHRFALADDAFMTGLTLIAGWITISREGGP